MVATHAGLCSLHEALSQSRATVAYEHHRAEHTHGEMLLQRDDAPAAHALYGMLSPFWPSHVAEPAMQLSANLQAHAGAGCFISMVLALTFLHAIKQSLRQQPSVHCHDWMTIQCKTRAGPQQRAFGALRSWHSDQHLESSTAIRQTTACTTGGEHMQKSRHCFNRLHT